MGSSAGLSAKPSKTRLCTTRGTSSNRGSAQLPAAWASSSLRQRYRLGT